MAAFLLLPPDIGFSDVVAVLEDFGFVESNSDGSHHIYRDGNGLRITIPKKGGQRVKRCYIRNVIELLQLELWYEENC